MNNVRKYEGKVSIESGAFYVPYVPLTFSSTFDWDFKKIKQSKENDQEFTFYIMDHKEVYEWILEDCPKDKYEKYWLDDFQIHLKIRFFDRSTAVEFKLRFWNV